MSSIRVRLMHAIGESGFGYRARLTMTTPRRDDQYSWTIIVKDNPNDRDWAAWTAMTQLTKLKQPMYPNDNEYYAVDGVIT